MNRRTVWVEALIDSEQIVAHNFTYDRGSWIGPPGCPVRLPRWSEEGVELHPDQVTALGGRFCRDCFPDGEPS
jgi:hypothetical protein